MHERHNQEAQTAVSVSPPVIDLQENETQVVKESLETCQEQPNSSSIEVSEEGSSEDTEDSVQDIENSNDPNGKQVQG